MNRVDKICILIIFAMTIFWVAWFETRLDVHEEYIEGLIKLTGYQPIVSEDKK